MIIPDGMLDPEVMDPPDQPFSYYAHPNDLIGAMYAPLGSEVTPEGYVFAGYGELMLFTGNPPEPVNCRIKTLHEGFMPVVEFSFERYGVRYSYQMFAADLGGALAGQPVNLVKVTAENVCQEERAAFVSAACRLRAPSNMAYASGGDYRFGQRGDRLPAEALEGLDFGATQVKITFEGDGVLRDGRVVYFVPLSPTPQWRGVSLMDTGLQMRRYFSGEIEGNPDPTHTVSAVEPVGVVRHCLRLASGESQSIAYKFPIVPVLPDSEAARLIREADYEALLAETVAFWDGFVRQRATLHFPEEKLQDYLLANTMVNLLGFDRMGDDLFPTVNKFQYHSWYAGGNTNDILASLEFMGQLDICREGLRFLARQQSEDGAFRVEGRPTGMWWEMWGYNLWGFARHYELTRDEEFLREVYPAVVKGMAWQAEVVAKDPEGLWPPATIADDAYLKDCRQTGQAMWGLIGLRCAVRMAEAMGHEEEARRFQGQYERFRGNFERLLAQQTAQSGGYIPPGLERTTLGNDWDNLLLVYPEPLFEPFDERVTATLQKVRGEYVEGLLAFVWPLAVDKEGEEFTFNDQAAMHYWQTPNMTQTALARGTAEDQQWALRELYAMVLHTSSTHMTAEFGTIPWSTRDSSHVHNILPQGTSAAKMIQAMRNMLVREQGLDLWLLSAVSPEWVRPGKVIEVREAPSKFGPLSLTVRAEEGRLVVTLPTEFREAPERIWVRVPWFWEGEASEQIEVPVGTREMVLEGRMREGTEEYSYEGAVAAWKAEYRRRWERFLRTGRRG
ncbi:MAG: hypothetical protein ABFE07_21705 [Armatimonadia bacterium]